MKHVLIQNLTFNLRYGEVVPLGPNYLPSYDEGVRTGLKELCPKLIGQDPTKIKVINDFMDFQLKGHPYVKSPLDMACWDILGKVRSDTSVDKITFNCIFRYQDYLCVPS